MTDPNKDEILAMAREAGCAWLHEPLAQRFAALCRADLVAEVERLKKMSVANIMVRIVPGYDGGGEEIYAKSVEEVNAVMSDLSQRLDDVETDRDDWKARALKAEQAGDRAVPDAEDYDLIDRYLRNNLDDADYGEYLAALDRLVTPQPAAQEPTSAVPANAKPEKAKPYAWRNPMNGVVISNDKKERLLCVGAGYPNFSEPLYAAGQKFIKENGK
jgi:hypothetical protein